MNRKSGALGLLWTNGKQHTRASGGSLTLVVGLLALTLAVAAIAVMIALAGHEVSPRTTAGVEAGLVGGSVSGELHAADYEGSIGVGAAQALRPDEVFVRSVALTEGNLVGYVAVGPASAPFDTLSMGPAEAEAYVRSLAPAYRPDEAFVRSVALTEGNLASYAAAGPASTPFDTLSMGPAEAEAYARSRAQAFRPDEAFVRSVALTEGNLAGSAVAGPTNTPFDTLSMGPVEAEAYARSLAQTFRPDEAFVRSVALTEGNLVGNAVAGQTSTPSDTLSMGPAEAEAYARSLAQVGHGSEGLAGGQ